MTIICLKVEAYNDHHRKLLLGSPRAAGIAKLLKSGLRVTKNEIFTHAMFAEQKDVEGWRTYRQLADMISLRAKGIGGYFDLGGGLTARFSGQDSQRPETERVGVACAILGMNRIAGLTEADWIKIPESNKRKTLDHVWKATDGKQTIRVEAKGTITNRPDQKSNGVSSAKADIEAKKAASPTPRQGRTEDFGVITAISTNPSIASHVYLLDPPGDEPDEDPLLTQVLNRFRYYSRHIRLVGRFGMLTALANRVQEFQRAPAAVRALDGVPLVDFEGDPFGTPEWLSPEQVEDGDVIGRILTRTRDQRDGVPFVGFQKEVFAAIVSQDWQRIIALAWPSPGDEYVAEAGSTRIRYSTNSAGIAFGSSDLS